MIDIRAGRFLMIGHLRQNSITVQVGDRVREGRPVARVGNSGDSSAPHLHIQAVDLPQMRRSLDTYPLLFRDASLVRGGVETRPAEIDPRRGDVVRPNR